MLEWRFHEIWRTHGQGQHDEAETAAAELLMHPRLSPLHQAGLHLLPAGSSFEYVELAKEAVCLYTEVKQLYQHSFSSDQQVNIQKLPDTAETALHKAHTDQNGINRERGIQPARSTIPPSTQTGPETTAGDSQRTQGAGRWQSTALTDFDDDTSPLPLIGESVSSDDDKA
ncbi:hypothetical protein CPLU01_04273 [Colletotrichum plurivorum]|uniref:Uncharacterized protein n=1 Tax=Colletotrichum plurivorum TaxID=2175906 RepID=A0A8H6KQ33_9PEZI|nr:hypothetical protein CPLU01_04273 [Colletotrichum plurivorum]